MPGLLPSGPFCCFNAMLLFLKGMSHLPVSGGCMEGDTNACMVLRDVGRTRAGGASVDAAPWMVWGSSFRAV